ncbi:MAG TPA: TolC family protein [Terracidiphilus sp.]|jgi:outer membrane protein TolC|nr:TolC family protein [Terracidiphilus sp.]
MQTTRIGLPIVLLACHLSLLYAQDKPATTLSLSLRDAVRLALSPGGNLDVDVADQSVAAAQARLRQSQATNKPNVDFSFNAVDERLNLDAFGFGTIHEPGFTFPRAVGPFAVLESRVHIRQSLFDEESMHRKQSARAGIAAAQTEADEVRDQIVGQVARLYFQAQRDASAVDTAQALIVTAESTLKEIDNRNAQGQTLGMDVSQARVDVAAAKQDLLKAQLERARTEIDLLNAMNRDLNTPLELTDPLTFAVQDMPPADQAVATALQSRGEILPLEKKLQATRLNDAAIHSERLPTLDGYANGGSTGTSLPTSTGTYDAGVTLRIPILDGGRRESQRAEVTADIRRQELQLAQLRKRVEIEVREALLRMDLARGYVELSEARYRVAQDELEHSRRSYAQGVGSQMDVNGAQAGLARAADGRAVALHDWNEARVDLLQALGTIRTLAQ